MSWSDAGQMIGGSMFVVVMLSLAAISGGLWLVDGFIQVYQVRSIFESYLISAVALVSRYGLITAAFFFCSAGVHYFGDIDPPESMLFAAGAILLAVVTVSLAS